MDEATFAKLLVSLGSTDSTTRMEAEGQFLEVQHNQGPWVFQALCHIVSHEAPPQIHTTALGMLYKLLDENGTSCIYSTLQPQIQNEIKKSLLAAYSLLSIREDLSIKVAECVASCAAKIFNKNEEWNALFDHLLAIIGDANAPSHQRAVTCELFESFVEVLCYYLLNNMNKYYHALSSCFVNEDNSLKLKVTAADTVQKVMQVIDKKMHGMFKPMVLEIIKAVEVANASEDVKSSMSFTLNFINFIQEYPEMVPGEETVELFTGVALNKALHIEVRRGACTVLAACCGLRSTVKKMSTFPTTLLDVIYEVTISATNDEEFDQCEFEAISSKCGAGIDISPTTAALQTLFENIKKQAVNAFVAHAQKLIMTNINSNTWEHRHAAVCILSLCIKPLCEEAQSMGASLVDLVVPLIADQSKLVRFGALQCISVLCQQSSPELQLNHHASIMPALIKAIKDESQSVRGAGAAALGSFLEAGNDEEDEESDEENEEVEEEEAEEEKGVEEEPDNDDASGSSESFVDEDDEEESENSKAKEVANALRPYTQEVGQTILEVLSANPLAPVAAPYFGSFFDSIVIARLEFIPFIPMFMKIFDDVVASAMSCDDKNSKVGQNDQNEVTTVDQKKDDDGEDEEELKTKHILNVFYSALNSAATLAKIVTMENMRPYTENISNAVLWLLKRATPKEPLGLIAAISVLEDLVICFGLEIYPRLPEIVPQLLELARCKENLAKEDDDEEDEEEEYDYHDGVLEVLIRIIRLEGDLKECRPLITDAANKFLFHQKESVRNAAPKILGSLAPSYKFAPEDETNTFVTTAIGTLIMSLTLASRSDFEFDCICANLEGIKSIVAIYGTLVLPEQLLSLATKCGHLIKEAVRIKNIMIADAKAKKEAKAKRDKTRRRRGAKTEEEEDDNDDENPWEDSPRDVIIYISSVLEQLLRNCPDFTSLYRAHILPAVINSMFESEEALIVSDGLDFLSDYFEHSHEKSAILDAETVAPQILRFTSRPEPSITHSVFNTLRTFVILVTDSWGPTNERNITLAQHVFNEVIATLKRPSIRNNPEFGSAISNTASAGFVVWEKYAAAIDDKLKSKFLSALATHLPLTDDDEAEALIVHKRLLQVLQDTSPSSPISIDTTLRKSILKKLKKALPTTMDDETKLSIDMLK